MAAKKKAPAKATNAVSEAESGSAAPSSPGKLTRIKIWNFRSIGPEGVDIVLDDIVVLVGENNSGKSSVLRAYDLALCAEEATGKLKLEDFHRGVVPEGEEGRPRIEIETCISGKPPNEDHWRVDGDRAYLRERFTWAAADEAPERETYWPHKLEADEDKKWGDGEPWGAANVRKGKRPKPYRIDAFASPDDRKKELERLLRAPVEQLAEDLLKGAEDEEIVKLVDSIQTLRGKVRGKTEEELEKTSAAISEDLARVFPGYRISLDTPTEGNELGGIKLFGDGLVARMGVPGEFQSTIDRQGAGAQRTLLWAALRYLAANDKKVGAGRGRVLLLDEPELCLHPNAVRGACETLYSLAEGNHGWQVMVSTHSPLFIDLSRDHTTIVRMGRAATDVEATELFRSDKKAFDEDDRKLLKLLNVYDPHVAEFFFGGRTVVVEGDTEYAAFRRVIAEHDNLRDVHIVRARGKYMIVLVAKILNQFGASYGVLHDFDSPLLKKGKKKGEGNGAWTANERIRSECEGGGKIRLIGAVENFEQAIFDKDEKGDKPYEAVRKLDADPEAFAAVEHLLRVLVSAAPVSELPAGFIAYSTAGELEEVRASMVPPVPEAPAA